jgi:hypothetical protein
MTSRLERLLKIDSAIRRMTFPTAEDLCRIGEMSQRTLFKDLRELRELLDSDIKFDRVERGYYNASPGKRLPLFSLTSSDLTLLAFICEIAGHVGGTELALLLDGILEKLVLSQPGQLPIPPELIRKSVQTKFKLTESVHPTWILDALLAIYEEKEVPLVIRDKICLLKLNKIMLSEKIEFDAEFSKTRRKVTIPFSEFHNVKSQISTESLVISCGQTVRLSKEVRERSQTIQAETTALLIDLDTQLSNLRKLRTCRVPRLMNSSIRNIVERSPQSSSPSR